MISSLQAMETSDLWDAYGIFHALDIFTLRFCQDDTRIPSPRHSPAPQDAHHPLLPCPAMATQDAAGTVNMIVLQLGRGAGAQLGAVMNTTAFATSQVRGLEALRQLVSPRKMRGGSQSWVFHGVFLVKWFSFKKNRRFR